MSSESLVREGARLMFVQGHVSGRITGRGRGLEILEHLPRQFMPLTSL